MSIVKQALILEIRKHFEKAVELRAKILSAKTEAKGTVYKKKLKKNNIEAADLLVALDRLDKADNGAKNEVPVLEGRASEKDGD